MESIAKRAVRTAKLLDQKKPGWAQEINLETLKMSSRYNCVIGQLYGNYETADLSELGAPPSRDFSLRNTWGFKQALCINPLLSSRVWGKRWKELNETWRGLIKERLSAEDEREVVSGPAW